MHTCAEDYISLMTSFKHTKGNIAFFVFKRSHQCEFDMIVLHEVQQSNKDQPAPDTEGEMADTTGGSETDCFSNPNLQLMLMIIFEISKLVDDSASAFYVDDW